MKHAGLDALVMETAAMNSFVVIGYGLSVCVGVFTWWWAGVEYGKDVLGNEDMWGKEDDTRGLGHMDARRHDDPAPVARVRPVPRRHHRPGRRHRHPLLDPLVLRRVLRRGVRQFFWQTVNALLVASNATFVCIAVDKVNGAAAFVDNALYRQAQADITEFAKAEAVGSARVDAGPTATAVAAQGPGERTGRRARRGAGRRPSQWRRRRPNRRAVASFPSLPFQPVPLTRRSRTQSAGLRRSLAAPRGSRSLCSRGPPALREKGQDLLNEHEFRLHVALDSANPGPALAAIEKREAGYLKAFRKLGGENAVSKARKLPKDDERTKFRATRDVLLAATGVDAEEPVWGAPFRALEELFGEGHAPMEALGVRPSSSRTAPRSQSAPRRAAAAMRLLDLRARGGR